MAKSFWKRTPTGYCGTQPTTHRLNDVLQSTLRDLSQRIEGDERMLCAAWPQVVGDAIAKETKPLWFRGGVLWVQVSRAPLLTLLAQREREWILKELRKVCPRSGLRGLSFKLG